ncbi:MAG: nucleotidyltransferase family protein [Fidelibacterota bacterium]
MKIVGLILAAGESSRMGHKNKLMMRFLGKPMLIHVVDAAQSSNLSHVGVVVGQQSENIKKLISNQDVQYIENEQWKTGIASSIVAGIGQMHQVDGYLILLGDMPFISSELIHLIIDHGSSENIVIPEKKGRQGNPVFFGSKFLDELMVLSGDFGAKKVIHENPSSVVKIEIESDAIFQDYDTQDSLKAGINVT